MNGIWGIMILTGIFYGIFTGNAEAVSEAVLSSTQEAVSLCITMLGVMGLWMGLMEIAERAGLIDRLSHMIQPFIRFLFPGIPEGHSSIPYITTNCVANILGLGWAATPAGLKAMEELEKLESERREQAPAAKRKTAAAFPRGIASDEMCTFLILNISSLQLIPVNVIAYRSQYGSADPTAIVVPGLLATIISTVTAVIFCKYVQKRKCGRSKKWI